MHKISLYLLGFKGFDVLQYISDIGKINLISSVLIGKDPGVIDDYSEKNSEYVRRSRNSIPFSR